MGSCHLTLPRVVVVLGWLIAALALLWRRLTHEEEWECDK